MEERQCRPGWHTLAQMESVEGQFHCTNSHGVHVHESVCVHHLNYLSWSSSTTWGFQYNWDTAMANSASSNPAGICSDPLQYSHTWIPLPRFTSWDWTLFSSHSLLKHFLSNANPLPFPSLSHTYHTFFFVSVCLYLLVSQVVCLHTGVKNQCRRPITDGARALLRHRWFHSSLYKFTHIFRSLSKGRAISDGITHFILSFTDIPSGGIQQGDNGLPQRRKHRGKNRFWAFAEHLNDWKMIKCDRNSNEQ